MPKRILLVDDDIAEISAIKRILLRSGYQALLATNTSDAQIAIDRQPPDLLIVASACDDGQAVSFVQRVAEAEQPCPIPLVLLGEPIEAPTGVTVLPLPLDPAQLSDEIKRILGGGKDPVVQDVDLPIPLARLTASAKPAVDDDRQAAADALRARAAEMRKAPRTPMTLPAAGGFDEGDSADDLPPATAKGEVARQIRMAAVKARAKAEEERARETEARSHAEALAQRLRGEREKARAETAVERTRRTEEEAEAELRAMREQAAEERASVEAEARQQAEQELAITTDELEAERLRHDLELGKMRERTIAEERAAEELRQIEEDELRATAAKRSESDELRRKEEELRRAAEEAELARREIAEQKKRADEEGRRRAETEKKLARLAEETRLAEDERKRDQESRRRAEIEDELERIAEEEQAEKQLEEEQTERALAQEEAERTARQASVEQAIQRAEADEAAIRAANEEAARHRALSKAAERKAVQRERPAFHPGPAPPPRFEPDQPSPQEEPSSPDPDMDGPQPDPSAVPPAVAAGSVAETPLPRLLSLSVRARITGRLDFTGEYSRSLYFEEGRIVGTTSAAPHERVEEVALRLGLVTRDQFRQAAPVAAGLSSRRIAVLLLERGFLKPTELTPLVRRHTEEVLFAIFAEAEARYRYAPVAVPPDERVTLEHGTLALAVEGVRRRWLAPMLDRVLGGAGTLLVPAPDAPPLSELGLSPVEQRLAGSADGLRTLDEIMAGSSTDPLSARQCLAALLMVGALSLRIHAPSGTPQTTARIDIARVREKLDQVRRADYFAILGLSRVCSPHEIREADERLRVEFDPRRFAGCPEIGLEEKLAEILRVVAEAGEVLGDDQLRAEYLQGIGD